MRIHCVAIVMGALGVTGCSSAPPSSKALSYFEGSVDVSKGTMDVSFGKPGESTSAAVLPYGPGANQVYFNTNQATVAWNGGAHQLSGNVRAVNGYGTAITNLTAVIDSITGTGVSWNGAHNYGSVAGNASSGYINWVFSNPGDVNFTFVGHAEGDVGMAQPCGQGTHKCVFVTSTVTNGNLGGLAGADAYCQARANAASLGGVYKAWMSANAVAPVNTFAQSSVPYRLVDGTQIAPNWTGLVDDFIDNPINRDETGAATSATWVWTGCNAAGGPFFTDCDLWTNGTAGDGLTGDPQSAISEWSIALIDSCDQLHPIYCFEQ